MTPLPAALGLGLPAFACLAWIAAAGFRNGDRAGDITLSAGLQDSGQPDEPRPVVVAVIRNPSASPVLAGLSARRARLPGWLVVDAVCVARLTARRGLRAGRYATAGVVPAGGTVRFTVPVSAAGRRYRLTAAVGQAGGRLRLHRITAGYPSSARTRSITGANASM